jgi:hypothetical protein
MRAEEFQFQERLVAEAVGLAQEDFDLVVGTLHLTVVDAVVPPIQNPAGVEPEGLSHGQINNSGRTANTNWMAPPSYIVRT